MDFKQTAAKEALKLIPHGSTIGFGAGSTMAHLIGFIKGDAVLADSLITLSSSFTTRQLLLQRGFDLREGGRTSQVDI